MQVIARAALAVLVAATAASGPPGSVGPPGRAADDGLPAAIGDPLPDTGFRTPVDGALTRRFDPPAVRWGAGHRGVDLTAAVGDEVRSPGPGVVTFAGTVVDRGVVTVQHPGGLRSSLEPVTALVRAGDLVTTGTVLGTLEAGDAHLGVHWGVRDGHGYRDPLGLLARAGPVVLLPPG